MCFSMFSLIFRYNSSSNDEILNEVYYVLAGMAQDDGLGINHTRNFKYMGI